MEFTCSRCGTPLSPGSRFCSRCGLAFEQPVPANAPPLVVTTDSLSRSLPLMRARGINGEIAVFSDRVVVRRGQREQEVFLRAVNGIEFRQASLLRNGYIEIVTGSMATGRTVLDKSESGQLAIYYRQGDQRRFDLLRDTISEQTSAITKNT